MLERPTPTYADVERFLRERLADFLQCEPSEVPAAQHLRALGVDSITLLRTSVALRDAWGVVIPASRFASLLSLDDVLAEVRSTLD